ncbi:radical SAM protein [Polyangium sp. 6x1]|uniref:SPL family radical SAM protein n=1 Tax=Polyangium sp. 6x1 TaxID=3042689 RepID=UPI0024821A6C|nr:radical SAM protein [Polyangium sp. 6x1]MDI1446613.1 radical SAM protein [Polyangium sp. 6x1]
MDLDRHLRALLAPLAPGDELTKGARITALSTELGLRVTVDVGGRDVHLEIARVEDGGRFAARTERLLFRYRDGAGRGDVDPALGLALCKALAARASTSERDVLAAIEREAFEARELEEAGARVREVRVGSLLTPAGAPSERHHTLSPYVGCLVGCRFCYAQTRVVESRRLARLPEVPWGSYVDVRVNAPEVLADELERLPRWPIKFCPIVSDPYHPIERRYGLTRACLQTIAAARSPRPVLVLTRCRLVEQDLSVFAALPEAWLGVSIPTIDDEVRRFFEPRGASIPERLDLLSTFSRHGVRTFAVVQPILEGSIPRLADALAPVVRSVSIDVLRGAFGAEAEFSDARFARTRDPAWQAERAEELARELSARGIPVWSGELPPGMNPE